MEKNDLRLKKQEKKEKRFLSVFFVFICFSNEELPMPLSWILKNREKQEIQKNSLFELLRNRTPDS